MLMTPDGGGKKKKKKKLLGAPSTPEEILELAPGAPVINVPATTWEDIINADPQLIQNFGDIDAQGIGDLASTKAALRAALIKMGGGGLAGLVGQLGGDWADLLDPATIAAAHNADTGGTSLSAQLEKANKDRLLAEEDVRAAKGILSSGQSGYEIGRANQDATIARNNALDSLLTALRGGVSEYASRAADRLSRKSGTRSDAMERAIAAGLKPSPAQTIVQAPRTPAALARQLRRNARRPIRRPIGGYE